MRNRRLHLAGRKASVTAIACAIVLVCFSPARAQRDLKNIPDPDPEIERASFIVADGFEVNLFAADPLLAKPIQMNFDAQGRLWIASSEVYPHIKPGQEANDKIIVLEDSDFDGKADRSTVFADGLLIPTGVVPGDGGAYVANSTELIHLSDTDGDGKADRRRVVLSGFGTEDTHHLLHALRWGNDGMLYMNQSIYIHSHIETPYGVRHLNGGGIWQFRPESMRLEIFCEGFVNPWGHHFDRWGQSFATDGAYGEGINYVFPGAVFATAPGATRIVAGLNPGSPKHCSLEIVSGRHMPDDWQGNMITNDFRANRVCRFVVSEDGSGYSSRQEVEVIKSSHVAFRPIDVKMGPDGALYIADWYNPIIQHGEVDFRDERRDHVHGRIWRVTAKGRPTLKPPKLVDASVAELLEALKAPEDWTRLHAKLVLKSRDRDEVVRALAAWLAALDPADPDYLHHRLEGLWTYQAIDEIEPKLLGELLTADDHRVRAAAVRVASQWRDRLGDAAAIFRTAVVDEHPRVRIEGVRALAQLPSLELARSAALALDKPMDRFLDFALWRTLRDSSPYWLDAVRNGSFDFDGNIDHLTYALAAVDSPGVVAPLLELIATNKVAPDRLPDVLGMVATLGGPDDLRVVLDAALADSDAVSNAQRASLLEALLETTRQRKVQPSGNLTRIAKLLDADDEVVQAVAARAAGVWKIEPLRSRLADWAAGRQEASESLRHAAIEAIGQLGGRSNAELLADLASGERPLADRRQAVIALAGVDAGLAARAATHLLANLPQDEDAATAVAPIVSALLVRTDGPDALRAALEGKSLPPDAARLAIRAAQKSAQPAQELIDALRRAGALGESPWKPTPELIAKLAAEAMESGDAARGETIYRSRQLQCQKCHAIGGAGGLVGPDLISVGASAPVDYVVESLLAPAEKVKENYHSIVVQTDEGKSVTGIVVRETSDQVVLRDAEDRLVSIPVASIEARGEGRSLMPDGAVDDLTRGELVDLVRFLSALGKVGDYSLGNALVVRRWEALAWTNEANTLLNRTSYDSAATENPALSWRPAYSMVSGNLPLDDFSPFVVHSGNDPVGFTRCLVDVSTAGQIMLQLNSPDGLLMWVDGKPTSVESELAFDLDVGRHSLVMAVNLKERKDPLRLELVDVPGSPARAQLVSGK